MDLASNALSWCGNIRVILLAAGAGLCATACASSPVSGPSMAYGPPQGGQVRSQPVQTAALSAGDRVLGSYKLGAPYQAQGVWYVPAEENDYDQTGVAGAYGDNLQGKATSNGERFDSRALTAAHATLPMPAIVEVTNLDNGRVVRLRLNDRGANRPGRLLDVSRGAAEQLGFPAKGTARVRVRYVGPARLDHPTEPLYVAQPTPAPSRTSQPEPRIIAEAPIKPAAPASAATPSASAWSSAAAEDGSGSYAVQAGAFSDPGRAEQVAVSLSRAGAAAVRPIQVSGRQLYRVVVGSWIDQEAADQARAQVASMGYGDARVIRSF